MSKKIKYLVIALLCFALMACIGVACSKKPQSISATIKAPEYLLGKAGTEITITNVKALDANGVEQEYVLTVKDQNGNEVTVQDGKFTATEVGKYEVVVSGGKNVVADAVTFYVYATENGLEYKINAPSDIPTTAEWGKECVLPLAKAVHVSGDQKIADIRVFDKDGLEIDVNADRFVPVVLGTYTVKYSYAGGEYSTQIECVDTSAPIVILRNNATMKPRYGDDFLLPMIGVFDAQEDKSKRVIKLFSEDTDREIAIDNGRIIIDASKYFTYFIHVEDLLGNAEDYEFIIERAYDGYIDAFNLSLENKTISWVSRNILANSLNGYREVSGYKVSLDGGKTFVQTLDGNATHYTITSDEFCEVVVVELSENGERESAVSDVISFDGTLAKDHVADFNDQRYLGTISCGSYATDGNGFKWNYENALSKKYNEGGFSDGKGVTSQSGSLLFFNKNNCQIKITFPKLSDTLKEDSVLIIRMYGNDSWVYLNKYGNASLGEVLSTYGYVKGEWCDVRIPVTKLGKSEGDYLEGVELAFVGTLAIDDIKLVSLKEKLTGDQVANFDMEEYSAMLGVTSNFNYNSSHNMKYEIVTSGVSGASGGALKIVNRGSVVALEITFPKKVVVDEYSYVLLDILEVANTNTSWTTRIVKHGAQGNDSLGQYSTGIDLAEFGHKKGEWNTVKIPIVEGLKIPVGQTLDGIQIISQDINNTPLTIYVDEVNVVNVAETAQDMKDRLKDGQVANYDDVNYNMFVKTAGSSSSYEINDGLLTVNATVWTWQTLKFLESKTVSAGDYIVVRMQSNSRTRIALNTNGRGERELFHSDPVGNDCLAPSTKMQTAIIPVEKFGLSAGDTVDRICIGWWDNAGNNGTFVVDYVGYISVADYEEGVLADYTNQTGEILATQNHKFVGAMSNGSPWYYPAVQEIKFDSTLGATVAKATSESQDYRAVRLMLAKPITVTANTVISIEMAYMPKTANDWLYLSNFSSTSGAVGEFNMYSGSKFINLLTQKGVFETLKFKATVIANVGQTISYLDIAMREGDLAIKTISVEEKIYDIKTLVMGDSYTSPTYWKTLGGDLYEINGYTIGVGGTTVAYWEERLDEIVSHNPNYLVMHLGVNDINQHDISGVDCATNLIRLINAIKTRLPNTKIYYITISNNKNYQSMWGEYAKCNEEMIAYAYQTENVSIIDFASKQVENDKVWANGGYIENDATHLTAEAYKVLSQMVIDAVNGLLPEVVPTPPVSNETWNDGNDFGGNDPY